MVIFFITGSDSRDNRCNGDVYWPQARKEGEDTLLAVATVEE